MLPHTISAHTTTDHAGASVGNEAVLIAVYLVDLVCLVDLVHLVSFANQKPDKPNKPNEQDSRLGIIVLIRMMTSHTLDKSKPCNSRSVAVTHKRKDSSCVSLSPA
jgi:hypothetical protein